MNTVTIWKEVMLLHWDGTGIKGLKNLEDAPYFWEHLNGFARYNKKTKAFHLTFSRGNILRLGNQFKDNITFDHRTKPLAEQLFKEAKDFQETCRRAMEIKSKPYDQLPKYDYKVPPLGEYQHRGVVLLTEIPRLPMLADCGMGKTWMVLNSIQIHLNYGVVPPGKTLICAKLATLESGWLEDAAKFTDLKIQSLWLPNSTYKRKEKILELLSKPADAYLINHEGVRVFEDELAAKDFLKVVVDESTVLKGFHGTYEKIKGGQFGRSLIRVSEKAIWRVLMTGTPAPNGPQDLWGQFYFLDPNGVLLERSYNDFKSLYLRPVGNFKKNDKTFHKWIPKPGAVEQVKEIITPLSYRLKIRDHLKDLPPLTTIKRSILMSAEQEKHYKQMEESLMTMIDDTRIVVPVKVAEIMKLRQVTGGFIIDNQQVVHPLDSNPKLTELDSILEEEISGSEKVVIYAQYKYEINAIEKRYKHYGIVSVYGENSSEINLRNIKTFREDPKTRLIVLHPKSAAHGITFTMAHYMVFYSINHSAEDNYQSIKRIERAGQKESMIVLFLLCRNSIDEDIYQVIQKKNKSQQDLIDQDLELLQRWRQRNGLH